MLPYVAYSKRVKHCFQLTMITTNKAVAKATDPGSTLFGTYGTNVNQITCINHAGKNIYYLRKERECVCTDNSEIITTIT